MEGFGARVLNDFAISPCTSLALISPENKIYRGVTPLPQALGISSLQAELWIVAAAGWFYVEILPAGAGGYEDSISALSLEY